MSGWGNDVWGMMDEPTSMTPTGYETEEERRRRLQQAELDAQMDDVPDLFAEEEEASDVVQAPQFSGTESPETANVFQQYKDWMARRPNREDTEPSTGRQILAGLAGFLSGIGDPQAGGRVTSGILEGPRRRAMEDWEGEGKAIGEVGKFGQDISETRRKREADVMGYEGTQGRIEAQRSAIEQRREAEDLRHEDRMDALTEDGARRKETGRHNKELEKLADEANRIRAIEAGARKTSAGAYASRVGALNKKGEADGKPLPPHYRQAVMDSIGEMMAEYPDASKWFIRDPRNKSVVVPRPGLKLSPPDAARFRAFLEDAKTRAKKNLGISENEDDVDEYDPLRQELP